jgi:hypothetical protein
MESKKQISKGRLWVSYILQGIVVLMFLMGAVMNILGTEQAVDGAVTMGYPESSVLYLGLILLISTLLYVYPKTSGWGAVLLTGWLGGAVATHTINGDPLFNTIFPIVFGIVLWLALWLRQEKVQKLISFK